MMKKGVLICFTGVDGSGKTTHARSLMKYLKQTGYSCEYVWGASRPIFSYIFFAFTKLMGYWRITKENAYTNPLEYAPKRLAKKLGPLLLFLYFIDFQIKTSLKIRLPLMFGKNIICDRYFYDLLMELERSNLSSQRFVSVLSVTLPQPTVTFLLNAPEILIGERRGFSYMEIKSKMKIFLELSKVFNFIVVDSSKDFSYNHKKICEIVLAFMRRKLP
ncbi:MAG: hypothetical protein QW674_05540 [Candidatus Bathyarchaeia archaeon]